MSLTKCFVVLFMAFLLPGCDPAWGIKGKIFIINESFPVVVYKGLENLNPLSYHDVIWLETDGIPVNRIVKTDKEGSFLIGATLSRDGLPKKVKIEIKNDEFEGGVVDIDIKGLTTEVIILNCRK